ncbi:hypothetical protein DBV15_10973 [Temnothorax longispinosus]|uniref:Uncharacterized protein n=1 Tax=Temnothorax longispinosus TaxID=300112 RepID=A0A4S2KYK0_9HYME|nr:hypothetical protein DBV15_10973 [Temnothorax longispinosus]
MSSTHFFRTVLRGTPRRTPVGGERLDKHGALSDGPSARSPALLRPILVYPRNAPPRCKEPEGTERSGANNDCTFADVRRCLLCFKVPAVVEDSQRLLGNYVTPSNCFTKQPKTAAFTRLCTAPLPGPVGAVNNKLSQFVSGTRASGRGLRGWRVACVFQGHRSTRSGLAKAWKKKERAGRCERDVRDRKALAKRKVVRQTDGPRRCANARLKTYRFVYASNNAA